MTFAFLLRQTRHDLKSADDFLGWSSKRGPLQETNQSPSKAKFLLRQKKAELKLAKKQLSALGKEKPETAEEFRLAANRLSALKKQVVSLRADVIALTADSKRHS